MILQALKNMYPKASEKVLIAVMEDLEKCHGKNMSTLELLGLDRGARDGTHPRRSIENRQRGRFKAESSR